MNFETILRPEAENDIKEAFEWYEVRNPGLGLEFLRCLDVAFETIDENPNLYQLVYKNIRRALTKRFPYGVFYLVEGNQIIILAVLHAKRDPELLKKRFPNN